MRRFVTAFVLLAALAAVVDAHAASVSVGADDLGAGNAIVSPCGDTTAATATPTTSGGNVTAIEIQNLPSTCNGGMIRATVKRPDGTISGTGGPVAVSSGSATITLAAPVASAQVASAALAILGPVAP